MQPAFDVGITPLLTFHTPFAGLLVDVGVDKERVDRLGCPVLARLEVEHRLVRLQQVDRAVRRARLSDAGAEHDENGEQNESATHRAGLPAFVESLSPLSVRGTFGRRL